VSAWKTEKNELSCATLKLHAGFASILAFGLLACGGAKGAGFGAGDGGDPIGDGGEMTSDGDMVVGTNDGGIPTTGGPAEVYGHSPDTLYKLDPDTKAVTVIGMFSGLKGTEQVIDIALDATSNMFATTQKSGGGAGGLYAVDRATGACTFIAAGTYPNSLSFVPKGTVAAATETLVGYIDNGTDSDYIKIDPVSGTVTTVGSKVFGAKYQSSGDIVSVIGGGTYLTVKGTGCSTTDCIIEVDPATGALKQKLGDVGHGSVFGLAFWAGTAYGFDSAGDLFQINFGTGSVTTAAITIPSKPVGLKFWGAGSTTSAPPTAAK
jgi:hypothetical protein